MRVPEVIGNPLRLLAAAAVFGGVGYAYYHFRVDTDCDEGYARQINVSRIQLDRTVRHEAVVHGFAHNLGDRAVSEIDAELTCTAGPNSDIDTRPVQLGGLAPGQERAFTVRGHIPAMAGGRSYDPHCQVQVACVRYDADP